MHFVVGIYTILGGLLLGIVAAAFANEAADDTTLAVLAFIGVSATTIGIGTLVIIAGRIFTAISEINNIDSPTWAQSPSAPQRPQGPPDPQPTQSSSVPQTPTSTGPSRMNSVIEGAKAMGGVGITGVVKVKRVLEERVRKVRDRR